MIFSISATIQDGGQNSKTSKHFRGPSGVVFSTLGAKNLPEISISCGFQNNWHLPFVPKFKMAAKF